jgi:hypothetical protein
MPNTIWNVLDADPIWTISGSSLIATAVSRAGSQGVYISDGKSSGKFHIEITITGSGLSGNNSCIGVCTLSPSWADAADNDLSGVYCYIGTGNIWNNGVNTTKTTGGFSSGNVMVFELDLTNSRLWIAKGAGNWNGDATANPATNTGGIDISALVASGRPWFIIGCAGALATPVFTLNSGGSAFSRSVSSGFTSGWPANTVADYGVGFDTTTKSASLTLSNSNRTAATTSTKQFVKLLTGAYTGDYYFEFYVNRNEGATVVAEGLANLTALGSSFYDSATNGALLYGGITTGEIWVNGSTIVAATSALKALGGKVLGCAVKFGTRRAWFRVSNSLWNNDGSADPATATNGIDISALTGFLLPAVALNTTTQISINPTDISKIPAPSGFTVGFPTIFPPTPAAGSLLIPIHGMF